MQFEQDFSKLKLRPKKCSVFVLWWPPLLFRPKEEHYMEYLCRWSNAMSKPPSAAQRHPLPG